MSAELVSLQQEQPEHSPAMPTVVITLPFNPKMMDSRLIRHSCNLLIEKANAAMEGRYSKSYASAIFQKLTRIAQELEYSTHKISVAILASPMFEKIYYLDFPVTEQVLVNDQFNFRELAAQKAVNDKFLLLMLSETRARICVVDGEIVTPLVIGHPYDKSILASSGGSTKSKHEKLEMFMLKTEQSLQIILAAFPYPVLLMGKDYTVEMFKKLCSNCINITETITGDFDDSSPSRILSELKKLKIDTRRLKEKYLLHRLQEAFSTNKLAIGIHECIASAIAKNARLLVVEKGYAVTTFISSGSHLHEIHGKNHGEVLAMKDLVESTIEKVLQAGGEVEFVSDGALSEYMHMALIQRG
ncbi:MAG TPA: hypothetical protein VLC28_08815 [Flavitalea sp.]|nr:hypothetical protein [Flavitalea sp.]